jgi:hypothetical protein
MSTESVDNLVDIAHPMPHVVPIAWAAQKMRSSSAVNRLTALTGNARRNHTAFALKRRPAWGFAPIQSPLFLHAF